MKKQNNNDSAARPARTLPACIDQPTLSVGLAISEREIELAQKLRYQVFAEELGARLLCRRPRVDEDIHDTF